MLKGGYTAPSRDGALQALTVAFTLGGLIQVANHHAASFNPAVTVALTTFQTMTLENTGGYLTHYFFEYFFGPLLGGIAAGLFSLTHIPLHKQESRPKGIPETEEDEEDRAGLVRESTTQRI